MAGKDTAQIVVGANGTIRVAPVATVAPADEVAAPAAGWVDLGYASEDGVTFHNGKTVNDINVWQSFYPARRVVQSRETTLAFTLRQWSKDTVLLAFGGGTITTPTAGHYKYTPPAPEFIDERALMVDWLDGSKHYRLIVPRGTVSDTGDSQLQRTEAADLPLTFSVLSSGVGDPWYLLTDDAAFV